MNRETPKALGIDMGTSSISAVVIDLKSKKQLGAVTEENRFQLPAEEGFFLQDAEKMAETVCELAKRMTSQYGNVAAIGLTGQMHGMLYVDEKGRAVSPLVTWQDKRGDRLWGEGVTYCQRMKQVAGETLATGYGFVTHFYNRENGLVPPQARSFCSVMDYAVMKLTGNIKPVIHHSVAASFGLFDVEKGCFQKEKLAMLGLDDGELPEITGDFRLCGSFQGAQVAVAIGDNQASFLGAVKDQENSLLVNLGTGSQVSAMTDSCQARPLMEVRPLVKGKYLLCGSALCGGAAYALLERFFRAFCGGEGSQYERMNRLAREAWKDKREPLQVDTCFLGKRHDPGAAGGILNVTAGNFTPGQLILGFICGICRELWEMAGGERENKRVLVASGNAAQKIPVMKEALEEQFGLPVRVSGSVEEAALGAALFSAAAAGFLKDLHEFGEFIAYQQ